MSFDSQSGNLAYASQRKLNLSQTWEHVSNYVTCKGKVRQKVKKEKKKEVEILASFCRNEFATSQKHESQRTVVWNKQE